MMSERKLEDYVKSFYSLRDNDYDILCKTDEDFFQITVKNLEDGDPDLNELIMEMFDSLALDSDSWNVQYEEEEFYSAVYAGKKYSQTMKHV